jgi:hypothetical protein
VCYTGLTGVRPLSGSCQLSPAGTGLTGGAHRSERCWSVDSRFVFRCVHGLQGCVLVPRSSGTPVATWAWPTWVFTQRRVLEAVFILLEFPSPSRRFFIGSQSLPLWFAVSVLQVVSKPVQVCTDFNQSKIQGWQAGTGFGASTLRWQELQDVE